MTVLSQLVLGAQRRADRTVSPEDFIAQLEWQDYVNYRIQELYGIVTKLNQDYNIKQIVFTLTAGQYEFSDVRQIAPDFKGMRKMQRQVVNATPQGAFWQNVRPIAFKELDRIQTPQIQPITGQFFTRYCLYGATLEFVPNQSAPATYKMSYIPTFPTLVDDSIPLDGYWLTINGWDTYVVIGAAMDALIKEESFDAANALSGLLQNVERRIIEEASPRNDDEPGTINDVKGIGGYGNDPYGGGGYGGGWGW